MGRAFKDQILWLSRAWDGWSEAEQVVALYSVARKLSPVPTRFLQILLTYNFSLDGSDILMTEARANDPAWVAHICESGDSTADLLHHLPLLRPTNGEAKAHYLALIPKVLSQALSSGASPPVLVEKARQILSYSLIHPALSLDERRAMASWLRVLEHRLTESNVTGPVSESFGDVKEEKKSSSSEVSSCPATEDSVKQQWNEPSAPGQLSSSKEDGRWSHLEVPPSPNNSGTSSRSSESESISEDNSHTASPPPHPGMRDIGLWLKSLRLHKYSPLLCNLRYEELLALDEETLEAKGVTKGARHKIILSIAKLKDRSKQLENIEKDLMSGGSINAALNQLKQMSLTPMLPSKCDPKIQENPDSPQDLEAESSFHLNSPGSDASVPLSHPDLPSQFTRVMGKVCTQLLVCTRPEDEAMGTFLSLVDRCLHYEAFTDAHSKRLLSWKQQILRVWHPLPPRGKETRHVRRWSQQYTTDALGRSGRFGQHRYSNANSSQVAAGLLAAAVGGGCLQAHLTPPPNPFFNLQSPVGPLVAPRNSLPGVTSLLSPQHLLTKRPSLQETPSQLRPHVTLHRTRSAPSRPHQLPLISHPRSPRAAHLPSAERQPLPAGHQDSYPTSWGGREGAVPTVLPATPDARGGGGGGGGAFEVAESDITNRLESLCRSMTEHALG